DRVRLVWPIAWFDFVGVRAGIAIVIFGAPLAALLALARPDLRVCRALAALFTLMFGAFQNALGATINSNSEHAWFWAAAIFVLLPYGPAPREDPLDRRR